jgi:hypothetical protein
MGCWFFGIFFWVPYNFWLLVAYHANSWQRFSPILYTLLSLVTISFAVQKLFSLMQFYLSILTCLSYWGSIQEVFASAYMFQSFPYSFLQQFQSLRSYIKVFDLLQIDISTGWKTGT